MLSYSGGGVINGGGASSSSNAGGLKDGARNKCIGLDCPELGSLCTCACVGIVKPPVSFVQLLLTPGFGSFAEALTVWIRLWDTGGVFRRRRAAPGHPHSN